MAINTETEKKEINIGERIRKRRLDLGMQQKDLAEIMRVSSSAVNKIEKGVNGVNKDNIFMFASALDTSADYLLGIVDDPDSDETHITSEILNKHLHSYGQFHQADTNRIVTLHVDARGLLSAYESYILEKKYHLKQTVNSNFDFSEMLSYYDPFLSKLYSAYNAASPKDQAAVRMILEIDENGDKIES